MLRLKMKRSIKKLHLAAICTTVAMSSIIAIPFAVPKQAMAEEFQMNQYAGYTYIGSPQDLLQIAENPSGNYVLIDDIDMTGVDWKPIAFQGVLDGNGHSILNLSVTMVTEPTEVTYDGNMKTYQSHFAGMFSTMKGATIQNLGLINERITAESEESAFVGGVAGYSDNSTIDNCTIQGNYSLTTGSHMFGVAGVVGFGNGTVSNSTVDVTLICTDTNVEDKDEQFMGGIISDGYMNISNCNVKIAGYDSDHGYVHNGGIIGMHMPYPKGTGATGNIRNCHVDGFITFFEDNTDRRAYCAPVYGEMLGGLYVSNNTENFTRDERMDYSVNLKPEMCANPVYSSVVTEPGCEQFGYTTHTCTQCGYTYTDAYTKKAHQVQTYTTKVSPTYEQTGYEEGVCSVCHTTVGRAINRLVAVEKCTLNRQQLTITKNNTEQIGLQITPSNATLTDAYWQSSDESVAKVSQDGVVKGVHTGTTTVSYVVNGKVQAECSVDVKTNQTAVMVIIIAFAVGLLVLITLGYYFHANRKNKKRAR